MLDPAICVKDLLVSANVGTFASATGWAISVGVFPDVNDTVILVNRTGGRDPYPHLKLNQPSVQVVVRGAKNGYAAASAKMAAVVEALLGMSPTTVGATVSPSFAGDVYQSCNMIGDVSFIGQDDNTRPLLSANFWFVVLPGGESSGHRVAIS